MQGIVSVYVGIQVFHIVAALQEGIVDVGPVNLNPADDVRIDGLQLREIHPFLPRRRMVVLNSGLVKGGAIDHPGVPQGIASQKEEHDADNLQGQPDGLVSGLRESGPEAHRIHDLPPF